MRFLTRSFFRQSISPEFFLQSFARCSFSTVPFISFQERGWSFFPYITNRENVICSFILKFVNHFSNCSCGEKKGGEGYLNWTEFQTRRTSCRKEPWKTPHALQTKIYCKGKLDGNTASHKSLAFRLWERARLFPAWWRKASTLIFCKAGKVAGESKAEKKPQSWVLCRAAPVLPRNYWVKQYLRSSGRDKTAPRVFFRKYPVTSLQPEVFSHLPV